MFNLTLQERQVILFLIIVASVGIGINFFTKRYSQVKIIAYLNQDISKINLNNADKEALMGVSGIGDKIAQRIIEYRRLKGYFKDIEDLRNIKGINRYRYESIKDYFIIEHWIKKLED